VSLSNPSAQNIAVATDGWDTSNDEWPGRYSYWYDLSKNEGQGGISSEVVCACSHGPCPEPCGGRDRDLVIAPGARREWRIPVEIQAIPGDHTLSLELRWYERVNEENASPKESQGDYNLVVDNLQGDCATVHLAGPSNKPLKLSVGRGRPPAA
jgi:hypothetical protein